MGGLVCLRIPQGLAASQSDELWDPREQGRLGKPQAGSLGHKGCVRGRPEMRGRGRVALRSMEGLKQRRVGVVIVKAQSEGPCGGRHSPGRPAD